MDHFNLDDRSLPNVPIRVNHSFNVIIGWPLPTKVACASTEQSRLLSLGSRFLLKERGRESPSHEVINAHFIKENTTFPVLTTVQEWTEGEYSRSSSGCLGLGYR
ncbi:uncharacterized protein N7518_008913 [Penicillium psychrosexuale]|uniref:uncharacterized protein n=1 Tax=Penicillium psychrosexuale TaxID=1002107 RepID=UPI0025450179|nr:uncharacterized protein N7518_008913 [Penicillium psychrosexuale]KAJ5791902.1 hypothetical protein N7518_008913 [Penicillium psychrosexuale]